MVLRRLRGFSDRLLRRRMARLQSRLAQYRRPGPQRLPDAARDRLPGRARDEGLARAVPAAGLVSRIDRRRPGVDVRRGRRFVAALEGARLTRWSIGKA